MPYPTQTYANWRSPRVQLADSTPAVLRLPDGSGFRGTLHTISLTGGLLGVSSTLDRGSRVKLMFLTHTGAVLGSAEMLSPVSPNRQPFRFVALEEGAQRRVREIVESGLHSSEEAWIEKYRAAVGNQPAPRSRILKVVLGALALTTLCLGSTIFLLHTYLPR
jgi:hypothetical protein